MATPTEAEIEEQIDWCRDRQGNFTHRWPGMSYEEGVSAALMWVTGESDDPPIESDPDASKED